MISSAWISIRGGQREHDAREAALADWHVVLRLLAWRRSYADVDLVFADALGGAIHPQRLTEWFGAHRKAAGLTSGSLHILRHTSATLALTAGVPVHIVAARLGDDAKTVLSTYAHLLPQSDELAAERVAAALASTRGGAARYGSAATRALVLSTKVETQCGASECHQRRQDG